MARGPIICSATETISLVIGTTQYISFTQPDLNVGAPSLTKGSLLHLREAIGGHYVPATVLPAGLATRSDLTQNDLDNLTVEFESRDDVWSREFLSALIVPAAFETLADTEDAQGPEQLVVPQDVPDEGHLPIILHLHSASSRPPPGPYVIHRLTGTVLAVARLYHDYYKAFVKNSQGLFCPFTVKVPSRLYYTRTSKKPLAGYRFAVKDVIDVAGYKTGCGNEGYTSTYPPASAHAAVVQQLCDAGAIMVGKTKSTMFGEGVDPIDWIEHHCPFNPRGDGYQKPSSSSTGSPVAVAAYPWLDFALGTDTGGSIRAPAGCNGIYGTRPSTGFNSSDGVFPVAEVLDTVGIFTRNASLLHEVGIRTMKPTFALPIIKQKPSFRLIYPIRQPDVTGIDELRWFPRPGEHGGAWEAECALEEAVVKLENHLKCKRSIVVLDDLWESTRPSGQPLTLEEATNKLYSTITTFSQSKIIERFLADYRRLNGGRTPFIDPIVLARQRYGRTITQQAYDEAVATKDIFARWISEVLLATKDPDVIPIMVFPQSFGQPSYRDTHVSGPIFSEKFSIYCFGHLGGCPDYTVPVAEVSYHSRISDQPEFLPVSLSVISRPGYDVMLFDILKDLDAKGDLRGVATGSSLFPV